MWFTSANTSETLCSRLVFVEVLFCGHQHLLIAIIVVSLLSAVANSIGKQFALSYICFSRNFTVDQFVEDENYGSDESKGHDKLGVEKKREKTEKSERNPADSNK